jgi:uncharacterized UBP type Zn finger protein
MFKPGSRIETKKDFIEKLTESGTLTSEKCSHLALINAVTPSSEGCEDCLKIGDRWVHLRVCLICGHVGCCNDSKNKHASKHFKATKHALIMSYEPKEDWIWCYLDEAGIHPPR